MKLNFIASLIPFSSRSNLRVCTSDECRYRLWGITVAPMIPIAMYRASPDSIEGSNPRAISLREGSTINISAKKEMPTINTMETMNASILRMPLLSRKRSRTVSKMVMLIPQINGNPNKRFNPMAIPIISARSQATIAV
ncbi:hypothetical protein D3C86_777970 [compost metagenome]